MKNLDEIAAVVGISPGMCYKYRKAIGKTCALVQSGMLAWRPVFTDESVAAFAEQVKAYRAKLAAEREERRRQGKPGNHYINLLLNPVRTREIFSAKRKPAGVSDARWRMELARRRRVAAGGYCDTIPESIPGRRWSRSCW